ncbi:hypothetical protein JAB5_54020 [Janthinobacterium sp. HH103]|uniref:phage tail protein n=1 Tax=Janthinobacterium sp. HH103 TaxID=1537275 RepID=UPI000873F1C7|nr:phage tail protein [Janthinobacterium sp. HH103]OEZ67461.1 hypothetical protein JAB5_54020 [Janthinobacterium sp. HH103]
MSTYFAILTQVGEAKLANAIALGQTLKLKKMGVGDGNGTLPVPDRGQKALVREVHRADLNKLDKDPDNTSQIIAEQVLPENVGGWWMRELGIYDEAGDLCAVANCPPSYKPLMAEGSGRMQVVRIVLIVASTAAIELKIDPSIVLATRKYVDDQDITVRAYSDAQLAKHLAAVDPHPLLAKVTYVDQQDTSARTYGDQQLAKHQAAADPHPLLAKVTYVDQQDTSARTYGDQQLAKHQAAADPHPLLAKVTYVDQQDTSARTYGDQQLAKHQAAADPHPLLAKVTYVDQQDTSARTYGDQQLAKHQAALDPHPLLAKVAYVDQQDTSARAYGDQQLAKHQAALDPHPLLAKVAYVDQQDTSARSYGDQQLAKHAAAADPHPQYSMKEVATLPKFDASSKLVNADFVQRAQGNMVRYADVTESRSLTAEDMGCALYFPTAGKAITIPDPVALGIPNNSGKCVKFFGLFNSGTILAAPGVSIGFDVGSVPSITIKPGQFLTLMATAPKTWQVIESTAELWRNADFAAMLSSSGYQLLPSGMIFQLGGGAQTPASGYVDVIFPIPFPNACSHVFPGYEGQGGSGSSMPTNINVGMKTRTGCRLYTYNGNALSGGITPSYLAFGN